MNNDKSPLEIEKEILTFWDENKVFEKVENREPKKGLFSFKKKDFVFFDGPPFANGTPHLGHMLVGIVKDVIPRYFSLKGYKVKRQWGWDCHGLPVEYEVEKELGINSKQEILEKVGIKEFNKLARKNVLKYANEWEQVVKRSGRWIDIKNAYRTMDSYYIESVWNIFSKISDKGLVKKTFRSSHVCTRCDTTLSNLEVSQGYKDIEDIAVFVKFPIKDTNMSVLVWTTTPWTLPGNSAVAVGENIEYVLATNDSKEKLILSRNSAEKLGLQIQKEISLDEFVGKQYLPPYKDFYKEEDENGWRIYTAPFVTAEDGTGIVHIAPAFGADDLALSKEKDLPIIHHVSRDGKFIGVSSLSRFSAKIGEAPNPADLEVIKYLEGKGLLFSQEPFTHSYPHCWRCKTPLINYATDTWIIEMSKLKKDLLKENEKVSWVPSHVKEGRFGNWIRNVVDWDVSRSRFWGAPVPIWVNKETGENIVVSSVADMKKYLPASKNKYLSIRHGQAESNLVKKLTSKIDAVDPLTELGVSQVKASAKAFKGEVDIIYSSPIQRCMETAKIFAEGIGYKGEILTDERIIEVQAGKYDGVSYSEFTKLQLEGNPDVESRDNIYKRINNFYNYLDKKYSGKTILVVSHKTTVKAMKAIAAGGTFIDYGTGAKYQMPHNAELEAIPFQALPCDGEYNLDLHRPYIDNIVLYKDGKEFHHIGDVFDCWFESGLMPYASKHYPFENKESFSPTKNIGFPADFIAEAIDQTRGWFYSLLAVGVAAFGKTPYKNVVTTGFVVDEKGKKFSKRNKNYSSPMELFEKHGADVIRYALCSSAVVRGESNSFSDITFQDVKRKVFTRLHNCFKFYQLYKSLSHKKGESPYVLDRYITSRLSQTRIIVEKSLDAYEIEKATREMGKFIEDLSLWYIRRSREIIKEDNEQGAYARETLRNVLYEFSILFSPIAPFYCEYMFQNLKEDEQLSVHGSDWISGGKIDEKLLQDSKTLRDFISQVLEVRVREGIKVRQPLSKVSISPKFFKFDKELEELLKEEINVEEILYNSEIEKFSLDTNIDQRLEEIGKVREVIRQIQNSRKNASLSPTEIVPVALGVDSPLKEILQKNSDEIQTKTNTKISTFSHTGDGDVALISKVQVIIHIK